MNRAARILGVLYPWQGYQHFNSRVDEFMRSLSSYSALSVNNHVVTGEQLPPFRATHFVRDPRDLVVSGYFYHLRGAESWTRVRDPKPADFSVVNGAVPASMDVGDSFTGYLNRVSKEEGLVAEIDFREFHFRSMFHWDYCDPRVLELRYEEVLGDEVSAFDRIFKFYGLPWPYRWLGGRFARQFAAEGARGGGGHVRDPRAGQWRRHFSKEVSRYFEETWGELPARLGYVAS